MLYFVPESPDVSDCKNSQSNLCTYSFTVMIEKLTFDKELAEILMMNNDEFKTVVYLLDDQDNVSVPI
jgi:hypothetical protein